MTAAETQPASENMPFRPARRLPMVGWFDPPQLARTAIEVAVSTIFGRHSDRRLLEALSREPIAVNDMSKDAGGQPANEMWFDYTADVGDGWNPTYAVAYAISRKSIKVQGGMLPRGNFLVLGGDQVYPTASRKEYFERLVAPYRTAMNRSDPPHPSVFALPGNHDWYDSLVSFTRLFCSQEWFGGWQTPQTRSYFALKLPHGWWLLGTDVQLASDIDRPQVDFFQSVAAQMDPEDRVILCNAEPHWIYAGMYARMDADYNENNLEFLEQNVLKNRVRVFVAGDLHHYRRHASPDGRHKITAGGGGAFLHPTHGPNVDQLAGGFTHRKSFPDPPVSRRLNWGNLLFPLKNPKFGMIPATLYTLAAWSGMAPIGDITDFQMAIYVALLTALKSPVTASTVALTWIGFLLFTDTHSKPYRIIMGTLHGAAHVFATFLVSWAALYFTMTIMAWSFQSITQILVTLALVFIGGWIAGSMIMGLYLLISLNGFGRHANEAFSALACEDWKNFLRFHIAADGSLTIYPLGIRRVPRKWRATDPGEISGLEPDDPRSTPPELIEPPIKV